MKQFKKMFGVDNTRKKTNTKLATLALTFMLCAGIVIAQEVKKWDAPESSKKTKNPVAANDENLAAGKTLYAKHCKSCHGTTGKGDGPKAANLDVSCKDFTKPEIQAQTDGELFWKTSEGRDPMPTFKKKTTDEERWQIISYVRTFKK